MIAGERDIFDTDIYLHVGFHKTGTTYLQKKVFPFMRVNFIFQPKILNLTQRENYDPGQFIESLKIRSDWVYPKTVISHEAFSGYIDGNSMRDPIVIARRLKQVFPSAKVLLVIRNQFDYLLSLYSFRVIVRGFEWRSFHSYVSARQSELSKKLSYDAVVKAYYDLFGKENVKVLLYEELKTNECKFRAEIAHFLREAIPGFANKDWLNRSYRYVPMIYINRVINFLPGVILPVLLRCGIISQLNFRRANLYFSVYKRILINSWLSILLKKSKKISVSEEITDIFLLTFSQSNYRLQPLIPQDLSAYGYPMLDDAKQN